MQDLLTFDKMLTPKLITFLYWLLLLGVVIGGITAMFVPSFTFGGVFRGIFIFAFGALMARIFCESMMVIFKINEALQDIRNK